MLLIEGSVQVGGGKGAHRKACVCVRAFMIAACINLCVRVDLCTCLFTPAWAFVTGFSVSASISQTPLQRGAQAAGLS